jgi:hypothetical protein
MKNFEINKSPLKDDFLSINREVLGEAMGVLKKPTAIKMYLYLAQHQDKKSWDLNTVAVANWLGLDYSNASQARKARNWIQEGLAELEECGFLVCVGEEKYRFSDKFYPQNQNSKTDKIYPQDMGDKADKKCPENMEAKTDKKCPSVINSNKTDKKYPDDIDSKTDTKYPKYEVKYGDFVF